MVRIAGYNVENLFTRPKILDLKDSEKISDLLEKLAKFKKLMNKKSYTADRAEIMRLYKVLLPYIAINIRSSEVGRNIITETKLIAKGADDWEGFIDFKRNTFDGAQVENTGRVVKALKADIQAFVEVEGRLALGRFDTDVLGNLFQDYLVIDGNDPRGIDVAIASKSAFPIKSVATNIFARDADGIVFSRDCLEVVFDVNGRSLSVLVNHLKAKDWKAQAEASKKRKRQASKLREILTNKYRLDSDWVVVLGDFNDEPDSDPLSPLVTTPMLHNVLDVVGWAADDRWTYYYASEKAYNKIDMIFVSEALRSHVRAAGIERRGMSDLEKITKGKQKSFPQVTSWRNAASDHAGIWADLDI